MLNEVDSGVVNKVIDLTTLCMTHFRFNGCYLQCDGLKMGSPLSSLMADVFMDHFEAQHFAGNGNVI